MTTSDNSVQTIFDLKAKNPFLILTVDQKVKLKCLGLWNIVLKVSTKKANSVSFYSFLIA